jgi:hypothetical protein
MIYATRLPLMVCAVPCFAAAYFAVLDSTFVFDSIALTIKWNLALPLVLAACGFGFLKGAGLVTE